MTHGSPPKPRRRSPGPAAQGTRGGRASSAGEPELRIPFGKGLDLVGTAHGAHVDATNPISPELRAEMLAGPGENLSAYMGGAAVLHGSCVLWHGRGVSFVGPGGAGKSTLTAWLAMRGAKLVSDGSTIVHPDTRALTLRRPRWRLADDSARFLGHVPQSLPFDNPERSKRGLPALRDGLSPGATLDVVYIVAWGSTVEIEAVRPVDQLVGLISHWYLVGALPRRESPILLDRTARLLQAGVRVARLVRPKDWTRFDDVASALEAHLTSQR